ncbi:MAG: hypothetical protein M0006_07635 [Magnetospirillum sp.]|nr:hypothetical protein [Magnetospirillum sp.]
MSRAGPPLLLVLSERQSAALREALAARGVPIVKRGRGRRILRAAAGVLALGATVATASAIVTGMAAAIRVLLALFP